MTLGTGYGAAGQGGSLFQVHSLCQDTAMPMICMVTAVLFTVRCRKETLCFHISNQLKLGAAAVQVLLGVVNVEVVVSIQIVGQEADAAFQDHQLCTPRQVFQFCIGKAALCALQETTGIAFIELDVKVDLAQILLVLCAMVGTEADGITKVIDRQARHNGIQVDDADTFQGIFAGLMMKTRSRKPARQASNREKSIMIWPCSSTEAISFRPPKRLPIPAAIMTIAGLFIGYARAV